LRDSRLSSPPQERLHQVFDMVDLSSLSISSVAPIFSVAAAGSVMVRAAGAGVPLAIAFIAVPFIICSWIFRSLNQHFPHAGASYHWSRRILGYDYSNFQAWIIIMAYFWSIPPILIPAAQFTLAIGGIYAPSNVLIIFTALFWAVIAMGVLLLGAKMTAHVTQIFLAIEVVSVMAMAILGYSLWGHIALGAATFSFRHVRWSGVIVCMVVAATIVDGWEIDSYAAEESHKPRITPGWGGVIGAITVALYYLTIWPILLHEVPLPRLQGSSDVLTTWSAMVAPQFTPWFRIAILASTAGSLWLTSYILSRALFAMSRDGVMPRWVGRLNRRRVPIWAVIVPIGLAMGIVLAQLMFPSLNTLFALVLSAAGFFLVAEFLLDGINMLVFLSRHHATLRHDLKPHHHTVLLFGSVFVVLSLGILEGLFFLFGPKYIGSDIDWVALAMLGVGFIYVLWIKGTQRQQRIMAVFDGDKNELLNVAPTRLGYRTPERG